MKYEYQRVGTYNIKVKVTDENGNSNENYDKVFIGEKDSPIIGYEIKEVKGRRGISVLTPRVVYSEYSYFLVIILSSVISSNLV